MNQAELKNLIQLRKKAVNENLLIERWDHLCLPPQAPLHPQNENHNHRKVIKLITWTTTLSDSMKLRAMPCRATQDRRVIVESSDKTSFTGEGNGKPLQYSCLENPMNSMKRQKDRALKDDHPRSIGSQYATGEEWRNNSRKNEEIEPKKNNA